MVKTGVIYKGNLIGVVYAVLIETCNSHLLVDIVSGRLIHSIGRIEDLNEIMEAQEFEEYAYLDEEDGYLEVTEPHTL